MTAVGFLLSVVDVSPVVPGVESVDIVIVCTCDVTRTVLLTLEWGAVLVSPEGDVS